jgi:iron complex transport system ATP-binding protein
MALELKASKVYFKYNADWILQDISFSVNPGEFLGIIGPNGSGKTTLIKLLDGILSPQRGDIQLNGVKLAELKRNWIAQRIAVVSPGLLLNFSFNVQQLVLMGRYPYLDNLRFEGRRDYQIAEEAMALTDVAALAERYFHELSGGERQRVLLARALAQEPELLLLDEPTVYLDINHTIDFFDLVKRMNRERGLTVVVVSHDINLAADYCNKLILLNQGKIFCQGGPQEVITNRNIQSVYGKRVLVEQHPRSGLPRIIINPV